MSDLKMSIGSTIKERRIELNIKQDDLAEQVGVTVQTMSKWERDLTEPKASQVSRLSKALKTSEKEICKGESIDRVDINPFDFIRKVDTLKSNLPNTEFMISMYDFIDDKEGFINKLYEATDGSFKTLNEHQNKTYLKQMMEHVENGSMTFSDEESKEKFIADLHK